MATTKVSSISFPAGTTGTRKHTWESQQVTKTSRIYTCTRTRTGARMPKWREVIRESGNATTSLSATWDTFNSSRPIKACKLSMLSTFDGNTAEHTVDGDVGISNSTNNSISAFDPNRPVTETDNASRAKFYQKIYEARTLFQGQTFVGELKEALHMLRRPAAALWDKNLGYLSALRKSKRRDPKHWLKTAGGLWLEQAFGWKPLIKDCQDAYKAYEALVKPNSVEVIPLSAGAVRLYDRSNELLPGQRPGDALNVNLTQIWNISSARLLEQHKVRYKGAMKAQVRATQWDNLELFGFNAENFIPTAWELTPWSFLIDYFTNIGDLLQCAVTKTQDVTWVNKTVLKETFHSTSCYHSGDKPAGFSGGQWIVTGYDKSTYAWQTRRKLVTRTPDVGLEMPSFQVNFDLSDGQLGNIAALLSQFNSLHRQGRRFTPS
jgi:hypothetical protein